MSSYRVIIEPLWGVKLLEKNHQISPKTIYLNGSNKLKFYIPLHRLLTNRPPIEKENVDTLEHIRSSIEVWLHTNRLELIKI